MHFKLQMDLLFIANINHCLKADLRLNSFPAPGFVYVPFDLYPVPFALGKLWVHPV